uniref:Alpha-1,3-glucosyltransferase n=1 Tax=Meloidogyne hapla TaxID=6305 RepID=A0A1I8B9B9_MELHA
MSSSLIEFVKIDSCDDPIDHEDKLKVCNHLACELYKKRNNQIIILSSLVLLLVVASCLAVCEYSGHNKPIMYGDFEAQRHWMELTINLPISKWYFYDLDYWGLDYPVLTAYHSWILGKIWVELDKSRGLEQIEHKLFMRFSVIITFMLIYAPALILLIIQNEGRQNKISFLQLAQVLLFPGLLFIDCAHFQYNHLSLGLFLWAILAFDKGKLCLGSALFVLALNHKQMELYHALPIAVFLFSRSFKRGQNIFTTIMESTSNLSKIFFVVFATFFVLWAPFLLSNSSVALQVLKRLFPFERGLFEDKVANFWCCASIFIKFKQIYSTENLIKMSTLLVLSTCLPSLYCLLLKPNGRNFRIALVICSLSFFLFSFQVHEKSILLVGIPALLLLDDKTLGNSIGILLSTCCFSLFPLCMKDGVPEILPFFIFYHLFNVWMEKERAKFNFLENKTKLMDYISWISFILLLLINLSNIFVSPPKRYPDLFSMLNALFCFFNFIYFYIYLNIEMINSIRGRKLIGRKEE